MEATLLEHSNGSHSFSFPTGGKLVRMGQNWGDYVIYHPGMNMIAAEFVVVQNFLRVLALEIVIITV